VLVFIDFDNDDVRSTVKHKVGSTPGTAGIDNGVFPGLDHRLVKLELFLKQFSNGVLLLFEVFLVFAIQFIEGAKVDAHALGIENIQSLALFAMPFRKEDVVRFGMGFASVGSGDTVSCGVFTRGFGTPFSRVGNHSFGFVGGTTRCKYPR
jgi:hypothetical protein